MNINASLKSPKTTVAAIAMVVYTASKAVLYIFDGDESTTANLDSVILSVVAAYGFFVSRDADRSSKDSGIEK